MSISEGLGIVAAVLTVIFLNIAIPLIVLYIAIFWIIIPALRIVGVI